MLSNTRPRIRTRTVEESSSSAEIIGSSDDLLLEILLCLPVKCLLKFKSVSKHWLSLITHSEFSRRKCHNSTRPPSALFLQHPGPRLVDGLFSFTFVDLDPSKSPAAASPTSIPFSDPPYGIEIIHSCNSLFCCWSSVGLDSSYKPKHYVYNPTTKQFTTLPPLPYQTWRIKGMNLAFDPSQSHSYKVICVYTPEIAQYSGLYQIQIYSSETRSWRLSGGPFTAPIIVDFSNGVYCNGAMHWVSHINPRIGGLVYFDVEEEVVREMPLPPAPPNHRDMGRRYLGETLGHLHLVENCWGLKFDVYEMERDHSGWIVKFRVDLEAAVWAHPLTEEPDVGDEPFSVVYVVRKEKEEDSFLVLCVPGRLIGYNFSSKSVWKICNVDGRRGKYQWVQPFQAVQYIETLSLV